MKTRTAGVGHHGLSHNHGVASERFRFVLGNFDQGFDSGLEHLAAVLVKGARKIRGDSWYERTEARIQVLVVRVDQFHGEHPLPDDPCHKLMAPHVTPRSIACE